MRDPDAPRPDPVLNDKAKHYERELHKIFAVDTAAIWLTWDDWKTAETKVSALAKAVRTTKRSLQEPSGEKGWSGPAADVAYDSLDRLSTSLDDRSREIADVKSSLDDVYKAVNLAKDEFNSKVNSISTWVDAGAHKKLPDGAPPNASIDTYGVTDAAAVSAEEDKKWEERNQAAKAVLDALGADTQAASAKMPIDTTGDSETPYSNQGPAANNHTSGTASQSSSAGYISGGQAVVTGQLHPVDSNGNNGGDDVIQHPPEPEDPVVIVCELPPDRLPDGEDVGLDPISSDGPVTGTTGVTPGDGPSGSQGGYPSGGGGVSAGGVAAGGIGGAAGLGGLLRGRAGGGMLSSGGTPRGGASSARSNGAGARGAAGGRPGAAVGRPGGAQMVPGGGGTSARGGSSARGSAVKGATSSGRYGVPKLGAGNGAVPAGGGQSGKGASKTTGTGKAGGRGGAGRGGASMGAAAGGGGRKGDKKDQPQDVEKLTHEDEEAWFEGTEESSPQVWE
ncbi:hypothetical protein V6K52_07620 [Knoellia sp. S7-12]|uniref:hypothetical protein n=1 Tax=Knoellia sp. S7-12 TaxID=3126698 RepID=UPI0033677608